MSHEDQGYLVNRSCSLARLRKLNVYITHCFSQRSIKSDRTDYREVYPRFPITSTTSSDAVNSIIIDGPGAVAIGKRVTFTATVTPIYATQPITYHWAATDFASNVHTAGISSTRSFTWSIPGTKTVTVTAYNATGVASTTYTVQIGVPLTAVTIDGPTRGFVHLPYTFVASVGPVSVTSPITYAWEAPEYPVVTRTNGLSSTIVLSWTTAATRVLTVTVQNGLGDVISSTHTIVTEPRRIYLPLVLR